MNGQIPKIISGLLVALFMFFMGVGVNAVLGDVKRLENVVAINSSEVAAQRAQNIEVLRRLERIERKLDTE